MKTAVHVLYYQILSVCVTLRRSHPVVSAKTLMYLKSKMFPNEAFFLPQNLPLHQGIPSLVLLTPWRSPWCLDAFLSLDTEIG